MALLSVERLEFRYCGETRPALSDLSFTLEKGDFCLLCGATGSGKSTLLRLLKRELTPGGERTGIIRFRETDLDTVGDREAAAAIGYVSQHPDHQIVTDRVWHELAFGLENLGCPRERMHRRVAETAAFFGMESWFDSRTDELSGGQKQLLNLAAVIAMEPDLLLLDEPTARLDPVAAADFLSAVNRLNRETGLTILMAEHRLEEVLPLANRMMVLDAGRIAGQGSPRSVCSDSGLSSSHALYLPASVRLWHAFPSPDPCPLSVAEGRQWLEKQLAPSTPEKESCKKEGKEKPARRLFSLSEKKPKHSPSGTALSFREVSFRFSRKEHDVLRSLSLEVEEGEIFCLLGGNGSGKTTALRAAAGLITPWHGEIRLFGRPLKDYRSGSLYHHGIAMLPQDPRTLFLRMTVREELRDAGIQDPPFGLEALLDRHPYDLSGGEQQLLGLARVLAAEPRLLLLDEPTNGLDAAWRQRISGVLKDLRRKGLTVLMVTHDTEFAAETADRCAFFFRGGILSPEEPHVFFGEGRYYTTPISRITRDLLPGCLTAEETADALRRAPGKAGDPS